MDIKVQAQIVKSKPNQIFGLIEEMNENKPYFNVFILIIMIINTITNALIAFQAAYQYPEAKLECFQNHNWLSCESIIACALPKDQIRLAEDQLHTYTYHYDLYCDNAYKKDWALFSFWAIGGTLNLIIMQFVDILGRKKA